MECLNESNRQKVYKILRSPSGNCRMNGFIGDASEFRTGIGDIPEYNTCHVENGTIITSFGCILGDSILVRQIDSDNTCQLFSWDLDDCKYTHIVFGNEEALNACYQRIKDKKTNLSKGDIVSNLASADVNMGDVINVLTDQEQDSIKDMFTLEG